LPPASHKQAQFWGSAYTASRLNFKVQGPGRECPRCEAPHRGGVKAGDPVDSDDTIMKRPRARRFDIPSDDRTNLSSTNGVRDTIGSEPSVPGKGALFESDPPKELPAVVLRERRRVCGEFGIGLVLTPDEPYLIMDGTDLRRWAHLRFDQPITASACLVLEMKCPSARVNKTTVSALGRPISISLQSTA